MIESLKNIQAGDEIVTELHGGGIVSKHITKIEKVINDIAYAEGADGDYSAESVYAYSLKNGRTINNYIPGFYSILSHKASPEEIEELKE